MNESEEISDGKVKKVTSTTGSTGRKRNDDRSQDTLLQQTASGGQPKLKSIAGESATAQTSHRRPRSEPTTTSTTKINELSTPSDATTNDNTPKNSFFGNHMDGNDEDVHNFGTFMDDAAAFPATDFSTNTTTNAATSSTVLDTSFDAAFAASDVPFDSFFNNPSTTNTGTTNKNYSTTGSSTFGNESSMPFLNIPNDDENDAFNMNIISDFQGLTLQRKVTEPVVYDHTPFTHVPKMVQPTLTLQSKVVMKQNFHSAPIQNPANGNIMFIATPAASSVSISTPYTLYEVDPNRNYIPVSSIPLLSLELQRMVATKYNATIQSIQKIWTLTMGLAQPPLLNAGTSSTGTRQQHGRREQLAAIIDLRVLEATTTMRLVVMWQRNTVSNQFDLYHVTTPPSGGDFASDLSTLQVSDGLLFVGGASPKGSCIFISKPSYRGEAWSANFVTGMGSVLYMSVSITKPHLVVALADKSITVWTYQSALRNAVDHNNEATDQPTTAATTSKRWLYPLCRLNYNDTLSTVTPEYPGTDKDDVSIDAKNGAFRYIYRIYNIYWRFCRSNKSLSRLFL